MDTNCCQNDKEVIKTAKMYTFWKKKTALLLELIGYNSSNFKCEGKISCCIILRTIEFTD